MAKSRKKKTEPTDAATEETVAAEELTEARVDAGEAETTEPDHMAEMNAARDEARKNWDLYLRERAELENFRKRTQRDKEEAIRYANDRLLREMIPVLDNLERAVEHAGEAAGEGQGLLEGVNMTIVQFRKALEDFGVKPIVALGEPFDPNLHQAMGQVESAEQEPNRVASEYQKGYLLHDRLLRPSLVIVTKAPAEAAADETVEGGESGEENE